MKYKELMYAYYKLVQHIIYK